MKKKVITGIIVFALTLTSNITAFAAPEVMPDGGTFDAEYYAQNNPDVVAVYGTDKDLLYNHYNSCGKAEGRLGFLITKDMYTTSPVASQQTLELLATGGTEGVHYKTDGNYKYYRLGPVWNWGEQTLVRTDFPDGLLDMDGNGLDDRDPINSMGFVDLNLNGIDDRTVMSDGILIDTSYASDLEKHGVCTRLESYSYQSYLCEHGIVCSGTGRVEKACLACKAADDARAADKARRYSGHVADDNGYQIGSSVTVEGREGGAVTLTYQGNDVWLGSDGRKWISYLDENDNIKWGFVYLA